MNEYNRVLTAIYREDHLTKKQLAADIGIAPATLNRIFADLVGSPKTRKRIKRYLKNRPKTPKWDCFVSVFSQPQQQFVAVTVIPHDTAETLQLNRVAFPIGWTPGDQFNAQTKSLAQVEQLLLALKSEVAERYLVVLPTEATNLLYPQSDLLLPYLQACTRVLKAHPRGGGLQLHMVEGVVKAQQAQTQQAITAMINTMARFLAQAPQVELVMHARKDSLGIQASAIDAYAGHCFDLSRCVEFGLQVLRPEAAQHDHLAYQLMFDHAPLPSIKRSRLRQLSRLYGLVNQVPPVITTLPKGLRHHLLVQFQNLPKAIRSIILAMPLQNWYDLSAQLALILSFGHAMQPEQSVSKKLIAQIDQLQASLSFLEVPTHG
jgi:hypothetical protein